MKSFFFLDTIQPIPRSWGVTVPSVSCPTITYPFSARSTCIASVPYGVMSPPWVMIASHSASPYQLGTQTSKASSPEKVIRCTRAATWATLASRQVMKGMLSGSTGNPGASLDRTSRERGPTTATAAHWSVTEVSRTRRSGHSVCSHSSR